MADTVDVVVKKSEGWKEVVSSGSGFFSASKSCQYCFAQSKPSVFFYGHRLNTTEIQLYLLPELDKMYVKADQDLTVVVSGFIPDEIQRIFITLNGVDEYFTFQNTKTFPDDFDLSIDAVLPTSATTVTLFGQTASADHYIKALSTGFVSINIDTSIVTSTVLATKDSKQRRYGVRVVGDDFIFTEDGATIDTVTDAVAAAKTLIINALCQSNGADFLKNTPSEPILTDLTTASNSVSWQLNRALPATTEQSTDGTNLLTYVGAPRTDLFTFNQNTNRWVRVNQVVNGDFSDGLNNWDFSGDSGATIVTGDGFNGNAANTTRITNGAMTQDMGVNSDEMFQVSVIYRSTGSSSSIAVGGGNNQTLPQNTGNATPFNYDTSGGAGGLTFVVPGNNEEFAIDDFRVERFIEIA